MIQVYTIKELVQVTGVARTTIHFYLRQGLLPHPQKTAASRSLYTQEHVDLLRKIGELKGQGQSLLQIEGELRSSLQRARDTAVDLAAQERERMHTRILSAAARDFASKGYTNTHVTAIMRELGITATLFYSHFPSKRALLAGCVEFAARSPVHPAEDRPGIEIDAVEELLRVIAGRTRALEVASVAAAVRQVEGDDHEADLSQPLEHAIAPVVEAIERGLGRFECEDANDRTVPSDLIAQVLYGAYEHAVLRAPLPGSRSRQDLQKAFVWLFLAARSYTNDIVPPSG